MFIELEPLLADRTLILTISGIDRHVIRVNVIPKARKENDEAEKALTTPLSITGSAAELDREFPAQLAGYTKAVLETGSTLQQVQEAHKAALKEIEVENKKALDNRRKVSWAKVASKTGEACVPAKDTKPTATTRSEQPPAPVASLFDDPPAVAAEQPQAR